MRAKRAPWRRPNVLPNTRTGFFSFVPDSTSAKGLDATFAFLAVFRVLTKDFFWIPMPLSPRRADFVSIPGPTRIPLQQAVCQTRAETQGRPNYTVISCLRELSCGSRERPIGRNPSEVKI